MEPLIIGICDDEKLILQQLEIMVRECLDIKNADYNILCFLSGEELVQQAALADAVFLDIEMPGMDGIETGRAIRKINPRCKIIMATGKVERFKESFQIEAMRFITKPFSRPEVEEAVDALLKGQWGEGAIELYANRNAHHVIQREIEYIMAYDGYLECLSNNILFRKECSLKAIYEELDQRLFVKISRKYIVNMSFIIKYEKGTVILPNKTIKVSRREKKNFEYTWVNYDLNRG